MDDNDLEGDEDGDNDSESDMTEIRFSPDNKESCKSLQSVKN